MRYANSTKFSESPTKAVVVVFEASPDIGGAWSGSRVYDDFYTQTPMGIAEFSSLPFDNIPRNDSYYGFFAARHLTRYLGPYVRHFNFDGRALLDRISLTSKTQNLRKDDNEWIVGVDKCNQGFRASKSIEASGLVPALKRP